MGIPGARQNRSTATVKRGWRIPLLWPTTHRGSYQTQKVGRNEPCLCASGHKWKHCHGANTEAQRRAT